MTIIEVMLLERPNIVDSFEKRISAQSVLHVDSFSEFVNEIFLRRKTVQSVTISLVDCIAERKESIGELYNAELQSFNVNLRKELKGIADKKAITSMKADLDKEEQKKSPDSSDCTPDWMSSSSLETFQNLMASA